MRFAFKAPDKYRMEGVPLGPGSPAEQGIVIFDGSTLWMYLPKSNQYGSMSSDQFTGPDREDMKPGAQDYFATWRFRQASNYAAEARFLREETIAAGGDSAVECYVIQIPTLGETWWVDKRRFYVVRQDSADSSTTYKTVKLNEPLSDDLFKFIPPPGASKIDPPP